MKKSQLKSLLKPLVKECVKEALIEQGVLSSIIAEVVQGLQPMQPPRLEQPHAAAAQQEQLEAEKRESREVQQRQLKEQRRKLLDATGFQTNIFEDVTPMRSGGSASPSPAGSTPLSGVEPDDAGIDINGIMAVANRDWSKMI